MMLDRRGFMDTMAACFRHPTALLAFVVLGSLAPSCTGEVEPQRLDPESLRGAWNAELLLSGESLPFRLELSPADAVPGRATGAGATVTVTDVDLRARAWVLVLGEAGTELVGRLSPDGAKLEGFWQPEEGRDGPEVPFVARRAGFASGDSRTSAEGPEATVQDTTGQEAAGRGAGDPGGAGGRAAAREWVATVQLAGEPTVGRLDLRLPAREDGRAAGRLELPDGAQIVVVGEVDGGRLVLRGFDGRRAVLMQGQARGTRIDGRIFSRTATGAWSAEPAAGGRVP